MIQPQIGFYYCWPNLKGIKLHIGDVRIATPLSELEGHLLVPYSTKANAFCELGRKKIGKNEPYSPQKAFAFVEYGTRRCPSSSDRGVVRCSRVYVKTYEYMELKKLFPNHHCTVSLIPGDFLQNPSLSCWSCKNYLPTTIIPYRSFQVTFFKIHL